MTRRPHEAVAVFVLEAVGVGLAALGFVVVLGALLPGAPPRL